MSVQAFRLLTGEDVIAEVVTTTDSVVNTKNPAVVVMQRTEDGRVGVGLQPFVPFAKNGEISFLRTAMSAAYEVDTQMVNEYNRIFGSGIVIASAGDLPR